MVGGNGRQLPANGSNRMGKLALKMAFRNTSHTHFAEGRNENSAIQNAQNIENQETSSEKYVFRIYVFHVSFHSSPYFFIQRNSSETCTTQKHRHASLRCKLLLLSRVFFSFSFKATEFRTNFADENEKNGILKFIGNSLFFL